MKKQNEQSIDELLKEYEIKEFLNEFEVKNQKVRIEDDFDDHDEDYYR